MADGWKEKPAKLRQKDRDARWTRVPSQLPLNAIAPVRLRSSWSDEPRWLTPSDRAELH